MALSRREASIRPAHARRFRDHLGTDSVRSKLPALFVPASLLPDSREASRDLWRSIRPSAMGVFKLRTSVRSSTVSENIISALMFIFTPKRYLYFRRWRRDETAATVVLSSKGGGRPQSFTQAASNELKLGKGG